MSPAEIPAAISALAENLQLSDTHWALRFAFLHSTLAGLALFVPLVLIAWIAMKQKTEGEGFLGVISFISICCLGPVVTVCACNISTAQAIGEKAAILQCGPITYVQNADGNWEVGTKEFPKTPVCVIPELGEDIRREIDDINEAIRTINSPQKK